MVLGAGGEFASQKENITTRREREFWDAGEDVSLGPLWAGGTGGRRSSEQARRSRGY